MNDTTVVCCGRCRTRYCVTSRISGTVELRYTPRELETCEECSRTDHAEKAGGDDE
jgi:hypothetical protein